MFTTGTTPPMIIGNCSSPAAFRSSGFSGMSEAPNVTVFALICLMPPPDPIALWTLTSAIALVLVVCVAASPYTWRVRVPSAAIAAMGAAAIFELPFDLVIWTRIYPPVPPDPALYRAVFFVPLVLVDLTTLSLLTMTPMVRLSKTTFFCLALMLLVFAVWALAGFGYPSAPVPLAMNVVSKILAFVTAVSLFLPEWFTWSRRDRPGGGVTEASDAISVGGRGDGG